MRRLLLQSLAFLATLFTVFAPLSAAPLAAQSMSVTINPGGGNYYSSSYNVEVIYCDNSGPPFWGDGFYGVELNSVDVTGSLSVNSGAAGCSYGYTLTGTLTLSAGSNTVYAWGIGSDFGGADATVYPYYASDKQAAELTLDYANTFRDVSRCVANCFAATASYATPTYTSLDVERGAALVYRSDRAKAMGYVQIIANDGSSTPVDRYSLRLRKPDGVTFQTLSNGQTEIWFAAGSGNTTLAAQFYDSTLASGAYDYTAVVRSYWISGAVSIDTTIAVRIMIDNGRTSPFGAGWDLAAIQRLYLPPANSSGVLVASGDGSLSAFESCGSSCQLGSPAGDFSTLTHNANGTYTRKYPDSTTYTFDASGNLTTIANRYGTQASFTWGGGTLNSITDPLSYATSFHYDGNTKIDTIETLVVYGSRKSAFVVSSGDLTQAKDPDGIVNFSASYSGHQLTALTDRRGETWKYVYSPDTRLAADSTPTFSINGGAAARAVTLYGGPLRPMLDSIATQAQGTSVNDQVSRSLDVRALIQSPNGATTSFTTNRWGSPTLADYPLGPDASATFDATTGLLTGTIAPDGHSISYTWTSGLLTQVTDNSAGTTVYTSYTTHARPDSIWGNTVPRKYIYNDGARTISTRVASTQTTVDSLDAYGRLVQSKDPSGHRVRVFPGGSGLRNTDSTETPSGARTRYTRDAYGRITTTIYPEAYRDTVTYDLLNRVLRVTSGKNGIYESVVTYGYDSLFLRSVTDARGQVRKYTHNALGWIVKDSTQGGRDSLTYDANGNVRTRRDRRDSVVTFFYDALNRVDSVKASGQATKYTYSVGSGSVVAAGTSEGADTMAYNAAGQLIRATTVRGSNWYRIGYYYRTDGRLDSTAVSSNQLGGTLRQSYGYTTSGAMNALTAFGLTTSISNFGNEDLATTITYPNSLVATRATTANHQGFKLEFSNGGISNALGAHLNRDYLGRIVQRARPAQDTLIRYTYNAAGRLQGAVLQAVSSSCTVDTLTFGYSCSDTTAIGSVSAFTYDSVGNITNGSASYTGNRLMSAHGYTFTYDSAGNMTSKSKSGDNLTLSWNALGQLVQVVRNSVTTTFGYDGFGRRIRKTTGADTTWYVLDGDHLRLVLNDGGSALFEYAYWPGSDSPHSVKSLTGAGHVYHVIQDPVGGSVRGFVQNSNSSIEGNFRYTAFGDSASWVDNVGIPLRFASREYDPETRLYYNRARYYDPLIGRFISEDPIGLVGGINVYAFAGNDPVNNRDPSGKDFYFGTCTDDLMAQGWVQDRFGGNNPYDVCIGPAQLEAITTTAKRAPGPMPAGPRGGDITRTLEGLGGTWAPQPQAAPRFPLATCRADLEQVGWNSLMSAPTFAAGAGAGFGWLNFAKSFTAVARQGTVLRATTSSVTETEAMLFAHAMYLPASTGVGIGLGWNRGSPNPFAGTNLGYVYGGLRALPFSGLGIQLGEAYNSCIAGG